MNIQRLEEFLALTREIQYGRLEDVHFDLDLKIEPGTYSFAKPMMNFIEELSRRNGHAHFTVLKIQDSLPMYGESQLRPNAIKSYKFA